MSLLGVLGLIVGCLAMASTAFGVWALTSTRGVRYYGRPIAERRAFRRRLQRLSALARPLLHGLLPRVSRPELHEFRYGGVWAPKLSCSPRTFARGARFRPSTGDLFVATQMKCGTTWMQQICYEILSHGRGNLDDDGHRHMYALSPWLESFNSVAVERAPRIGASSTRIIKTHLPARMLPYSSHAKYIYVTRHPVACFQSCVDFMQMLGGPLARTRAQALDWFCSERMWWGPWPEHVLGYWQWSQSHANVLFVHFEALRDDLEGEVSRVAAFLGERLSGDELKEVLRRCGYAYMKEREEWFEMSPPTPYSVGKTTFVAGASHRRSSANEDERSRIYEFCASRLEGSSYPLGTYFPALTKSGRAPLSTSSSATTPDEESRRRISPGAPCAKH